MTEATHRVDRPSEIMIVDDHPLVRLGLRELLSHQPDMTVCGEAQTVPEALALARQLSPDLIIIDLSLKGSSGLELVKELRGGRAKLLVSSMYDDTLYAERAVAAGAQGYINKQEAPERMLHAIRAVLSGRHYLGPAVIDRLVHRVSQGETKPAADETCLSNRELEVLERLGRGKTIKEIAVELSVSPKTVETHRQNIKSKLGVSTAVELTARAASWITSGSRGAR